MIFLHAIQTTILNRPRKRSMCHNLPIDPTWLRCFWSLFQHQLFSVFLSAFWTCFAFLSAYFAVFFERRRSHSFTLFLLLLVIYSLSSFCSFSLLTSPLPFWFSTFFSTSFELFHLLLCYASFLLYENSCF